jgi:hypothetical protein
MNPKASSAWVLAAVVASLGAPATLGAATTPAKVPITCSRGPSGQSFTATVIAPDKTKQGDTYTVRIDSASSGVISHTGLNYLHDMETEYLVPTGTKYVEGSARIVPGTGTPNVQKGALAWHDKGVIHMLLPGKVESGTSHTPPSLEFKLTATSAPGNKLALKFLRYRVTANAIVVGDLKTTCDPTPSPYTIANTVVQ